MKTIQQWFWGVMINKGNTKRLGYKSFVVPVLITGMLYLLPFISPPFNYWLALVALLIGPGWGIPRILFPGRALSLPERLFITILSSIFIDTATFAILNSLKIPISKLVILIYIISLTYIVTLAATIFRPIDIDLSPSQSDEPAWLSFACGVILAALVISVIINFQ